MANGDIQIAPVNMGQTMVVMATALMATINTFCHDDRIDEEKTAITYMALAVFFHQLCTSAKHKDKMIAVLKAVIAELEVA